MSGIAAQLAGNPLFSSNMGALALLSVRGIHSRPPSDGLAPYAEMQLTSFNPSQPYDISLHLVVPTTPSNYDLGNFMTTLTLTGPSNRTLTTIRKPVRPALIFPTYALHHGQ